MKTWIRGVVGFACLIPLVNAAIIVTPSYTARGDSDPGGVAFNYIDITGTGSLLFPASDDLIVPVNMGAAFTFYGETATQAIVSSNGVITFTVGSNEFLNSALPANAFSYRTLFPYWDDLLTSAYYQFFAGGVGPFAGPTSVIQWIGGYCDNQLTGCSSAGTVSFEALLDHATGSILYQYASSLCPPGDCLSNHDFGASATVGIQGVGANLSEALQWSFNSPVIADNSTVLFTPTPEPSSWLLLSLGLGAFGLRRRLRG
ncbi:MAG: PEP-CTERM sorting domain-containing protein [Bryobacteraceae bacterium]